MRRSTYVTWRESPGLLLAAADRIEAASVTWTRRLPREVSYARAIRQQSFGRNEGT